LQPDVDENKLGSKCKYIQATTGNVCKLQVYNTTIFGKNTATSVREFM